MEAMADGTNAREGGSLVRDFFGEEMALAADISHPSNSNRFLNVFDVNKTRNLLYMNLPPFSFSSCRRYTLVQACRQRDLLCNDL